MKKIIYLLMVLLFATSACKKDSPVPKKAFEDITFQDIKNLEYKMSYQEFKVRQDNQVKSGAVILFNVNNYYWCKMKIVSINQIYTLTFDLVVYNQDGTIKWNKTGLNLANTSTFDFDTATATQNPGGEDFHFIALNDAWDMSIFPYPSRYLYVYSV